MLTGVFVCWAGQQAPFSLPFLPLLVIFVIFLHWEKNGETTATREQHVYLHLQEENSNTLFLPVTIELHTCSPSPVPIVRNAACVARGMAILSWRFLAGGEGPITPDFAPTLLSSHVGNVFKTIWVDPLFSVSFQQQIEQRERVSLVLTWGSSSPLCKSGDTNLFFSHF